jgi:hypothetical protein
VPLVNVVRPNGMAESHALIQTTTIVPMYHYDPATALEELSEEAILPNPVHVRDMILRKRLTPDRSLEINRLFVEYQKFFGEAQKLGKEILKQLAER